MNNRRRTSQGVEAPKKHTSPSLSLPSPLGGHQPVVVLDTPLANRFAGFSVISAELSTAGEMFTRAQTEVDRLLVSALWRAGVAIYARCFSSTGSGMPKLEESDHLGGSSPDLKAMHERLMATRHGFLSHAGHSDIEGSSAQAILNDPRIALGVVALVAARTVASVPSPEELASVLRLISLVQLHVQSSMLAAHARALAEVHAMPVDELYANAQQLPKGA